MLLLASDLVMVRCIMLCIVMLIFAFNDITEGTRDDLWIFLEGGAVENNERNIIKKYMIHI